MNETRPVSRALAITALTVGACVAGCKGGRSVISRQTFCTELDAANAKVRSKLSYGIATLKSLAKAEAKTLSKGTHVDGSEALQRAKSCAGAALSVQRGWSHLLGVDRASHIFFGLGIDKRHEKAGRVHSELSNHVAKGFDGATFYRACTRREKAGGVAALEATAQQIAQLMKPYYALCRQLGAKMRGDK